MGLSQIALRVGDPEIKGALRQEDGLRIVREVLARRKTERLAEIQRHQPPPRPRCGRG